MTSDTMPSSDKAVVTIKKYANRRLYNTGTSAYVTLEDLAQMVKRGDDFVVFDARNNEDITRSVLAQIIFEQEGKSGQSLLPITFLRQLIRFYGDSMQMLVPSYLEFSLDKLAKEKGGFAALFGNDALKTAALPMFTQIEEQTRQNMALFRQALSVFTPFGGAPGHDSARQASPTAGEPRPTPATADDPNPGATNGGGTNGGGTSRTSEFDEMRRQLDDLQRRVESLAPKL